jgi:hypothetical protein
MVFCFEIEWWAQLYYVFVPKCLSIMCGKSSYLVVVDNNMNLNISLF